MYEVHVHVCTCMYVHNVCATCMNYEVHVHICMHVHVVLYICVYECVNVVHTHVNVHVGECA